MDDIIEIKTGTRGIVTIVSKKDADLSQYQWWVVKEHVRGRINEKRRVYIHRIILERIVGRPLQRKEKTDHINQNPLDNTRDNLRLATHPQNLSNRPKPSNNTSGYKGVSFMPKHNRWRTSVGTKHVGVFNNPEEAARAYDAVALKKYGEFAVLNFPNDIIEFIPNVLGSDNTSGYRGVSKSSKYKWVVELGINGNKYRLSGFSNPQDAARAYDELARQHLGDKAKLNFPNSS